MQPTATQSARCHPRPPHLMNMSTAVSNTWSSPASLLDTLWARYLGGKQGGRQREERGHGQRYTAGEQPVRQPAPLAGRATPQQANRPGCCRAADQQPSSPSSSNPNQPPQQQQPQQLRPCTAAGHAAAPPPPGPPPQRLLHAQHLRLSGRGGVRLAAVAGLRAAALLALLLVLLRLVLARAAGRRVPGLLRGGGGRGLVRGGHRGGAAGPAVALVLGPGALLAAGVAVPGGLAARAAQQAAAGGAAQAAVPAGRAGVGELAR
jgi:hypothetical protein